MKSLVRVLPAAAYTFNTVPICDPGGPNPHGLVWETFPAPVRDFTPRLHYSRETGFPKPDSEAGLPKPDSDPAPDSLGIGLSPNSSPNTRSYSLNQSVHYSTLLGCPTLLLGRRTPLRLTSEAGLPKPDSLGIGLSPNSSPNTRSYSLNQSVHY